jgi:hypothetical protein
VPQKFEFWHNGLWADGEDAAPLVLASIWEGEITQLRVHPQTGRVTFTMEWRADVTNPSEGDASEAVPTRRPRTKVTATPGVLAPLVDEYWWTLQEMVGLTLYVSLSANDEVLALSYRHPHHTSPSAEAGAWWAEAMKGP